jgi:hypothetical protein
MAKFNPAEYETVEDRLKIFWKENPEGRIETDIIHITTDGTCVTIQAQIYRLETDARPVSTGIAQETKGQGGFANADAWMENCETSAIGRALANWKYQGSNKKRPSLEEMSKTGTMTTPKVEVFKPEEAPMTKEDAVTLNNSAQEFAKDIGAETSTIADQVNHILEGMIPNTTKRNELKKKVYGELTGNGLNKDLEQWTTDDTGLFISTIEKELELVDAVSQVFETNVVKVCPVCNTAGNVEDNREKKASDDKFAKIPDFTCSNYGENNGCGKGFYIGNKELPEEWL